jgi:hypothetical protein
MQARGRRLPPEFVFHRLALAGRTVTAGRNLHSGARENTSIYADSLVTLAGPGTFGNYHTPFCTADKMFDSRFGRHSPCLNSQWIRAEFRKTNRDYTTLHGVGLADHFPSSRPFGQRRHQAACQHGDRRRSRTVRMCTNWKRVPATGLPVRCLTPGCRPTLIKQPMLDLLLGLLFHSC